MNISQLRALVKHGESETLEFKTSTANIGSGMQTVCAFLNGEHESAIIFGVKDDGKIIGQTVTDKTRKEIAIELNKLEPHAQTKIDIKYVRIVDDLQAIIFLVKPGEHAPYTYDGRSFMRNQSTTMRMPKEEYIYLYNQNNPEAWERLTTNSCTIKDLDQKRIKEVVRSAVAEKRLPAGATTDSTSSILKKLGLIIDGKLTNAAVILFCKDEYKQFMQSNVKLARFKGATKSEFLDTKMYRANIFDLYDKAEAFLVFVLPIAARIVSGQSERLETPAIPYTVLREALVNAFVHRDYSHAGGSVDIAVYDDRVEITNTGFLPHGIDIKQLMTTHKSVLRNPLIAHVLYVCGKIEKWGRGTLDMIRDCKAAGNPPPKFKEIGGGFSVTLPLKESISTVIYEQPEKSHAHPLTDRQKDILRILEKGAMSRQQLMEDLHITITDRGMQLELSKLNKLGLIEREGVGKFIVWFLVKSKQ